MVSYAVISAGDMHNAGVEIVGGSCEEQCPNKAHDVWAFACTLLPHRNDSLVVTVKEDPFPLPEHTPGGASYQHCIHFPPGDKSDAVGREAEPATGPVPTITEV